MNEAEIYLFISFKLKKMNLDKENDKFLVVDINNEKNSK
jgi:hypothetical protein